MEATTPESGELEMARVDSGDAGPDDVKGVPSPEGASPDPLEADTPGTGGSDAAGAAREGSSDAEETSPGDAERPGPRRYDFGRPAGIANETRRLLDRAFEEAAGALSGWLRGEIREPVRTSVDRLEECRFGAVRSELPEPCAAFILGLDGCTDPAILHIDSQLAFTVLERSFGSRAEQIHVPERALTWIERVVLREAIQNAVQAACHAWHEKLPLDMSIAGFETAPELLSPSDQDATVAARFRFDGEGWTGYLDLAVPGSAVTTALARRRDERPETDPLVGAENRRRLERVLRRASLPISVRLPQFPVRLREVSGLREGVVLDSGLLADAEVEVHLSDQLRFVGRVGRQGDHLAVEVIESIPPGAERPNPFQERPS